MIPLLSLTGLTVARAGVPVLREAALQLFPRDRLAIVGPNGAGKTTLLRTIVGLEPVAAGRLVLFGQPCTTERDFRPLRPRIGFLFQDSDDQLFCPTGLEDVCFGPLNCGLSPAEAEARGWKVAQEKNDEYKRLLSERGMKIHKPSPKLDADMRQVGGIMQADWLKAAGPDGAAIVDAYKAKK